MEKADTISQARMRLVETGGRTSQDLGLGRIVGQILVYLYLQRDECSLDVLESELGLSKASVSVAARQLEQLGLIRRVWIKGERKKYYRSAENIASALQQGLLSQVRNKVQYFGGELDLSMALLDDIAGEQGKVQEVEFLRKRVERARKLQKRLDRVLGNPLIKLLTRVNSD
jgi:DNA-binding transcriptional regulator GbsR (MarR family)